MAGLAVVTMALGLAGLSEGDRVAAPAAVELAVRVVHEVSGAPLERAFVNLRQDGDGGEVRMAEVADAEGRVRLRGLAPDRPCEIQARHPACVGRVVEWRPGASRELEIRLAPLGVVRGKVVESFEGELALASVQLVRDTGERLAGSFDADGRFEYEGVPFDVPLRLSAHALAGAKCESVFTLSSDRPEHVQDLHLEAAGEVRVTLLTTDGTRHPEAWISVAPLERSGTYRDGLDPIGLHDPHTGEEVFRLAEPGRYAVVYHCRDWRSEPVHVDVARGGRARVEVGPVPPERTVRGLLLNALGDPLPQHAIVVDAGSRWQTDASGRFELLLVGEGPFDLDVQPVLPASGVATFLRGVELEDLEVVLQLPVPATVRWSVMPPWSVPRLSWTARGSDAFAEGDVRGSEGSFEVALGLFGAPLSFRLGHIDEPALLQVDDLVLGCGDVLDLGEIDLRERDVAGVVLRPDGRPLPDVRVQGVRGGWPGPWDTTSGSHGRFVLEGVPVATGVSLRASAGAELRSQDVPISAGTGETIVRLRRLPRVEGRVVSRSGALLGRALVAARRELGGYPHRVRVHTSPEGAFSLVLEPDRYELETRPFGGELVPGPAVEVGWDEALEIVLEVP